MNEMIFSQANAWGFPCACSVQGNCQILPQQKTERWTLQLVGDRWLLLVGDVPQINLHPQEATVFLERRRSCENLEAVEPYL
jgi:hypothetical protein